MTVWKSVGVSRYKGDTNGVEQFMSEHAANRVLDLIELVATLPGCRRLTVNEGRRTRARQKVLRTRFENGTGPLAAVLYTSRHDEVKHGNAADLGGPDGEALNAAEIAAIVKYGPALGVHFTGLTFVPREPWHVEADETPYTRQYGLTAAPTLSEEDDMRFTLIAGKQTGWKYAYLLDAEDGKRRALSQLELAIFRSRSVGKLPEVGDINQAQFDAIPKKAGSL